MRILHLSSVLASAVVSTLLATDRPQAAPPSAETPVREDVAERIAQVENGLRPSVRIKGGSVWSLKQSMERLGVPGVAIAVIDDYSIDWVKAYGVTDVVSKEPVTNETLFQAASISKPVAAAVALHFVGEGLLDLDGNVNDKLRSWKVPENDLTRTEKVTLRRILSHTAGLTVSGFRGYAPGEPKPTILQVLDGTPPANSAPVRVDATPGSIYRYSGGGYTVLQLLLEDVTGVSLPDLARKLIFDPLDMAHSSFEKPLPAALLENTSSGHTRDGTPMQGHWFLNNGSTCCGLWTTPADLARFAIAIQSSLRGASPLALSSEMARLMVTPQPPAPSGLGMFLEDDEGTVYFSHSGGNPGFACLLIASRDGGHGAAIMTNSDNGHALCQEIVQSVAVEYEWVNYASEEFESIGALVDTMRTLKVANPNEPRVSENALNRLGYKLLQAEELDHAVAIFELNVEFNPKSANVYDSLAEAYMTIGSRERAIDLYEKALETLDRYPEENQGSDRLRESVPKQLDRLRGGQ